MKKAKKHRACGVKFVSRDTESRRCQARAMYWEKKLGIAGHTSDTYNSEYKHNVTKIREAWARGEDPFDVNSLLCGLGFRSQWTPKAPVVSLGASLIPGEAHGKNTSKPRRKTRS